MLDSVPRSTIWCRHNAICMRDTRVRCATLAVIFRKQIPFYFLTILFSCLSFFKHINTKYSIVHVAKIRKQPTVTLTTGLYTCTPMAIKIIRQTFVYEFMSSLRKIIGFYFYLHDYFDFLKFIIFCLFRGLNTDESGS